MPFDVAARDGVLTLTLDTPGSAVNIFNHATAHQLIEILADVSPATTRAIVFETAKPGSFINGVGLLLAQAAQTYADVERASSPPWAAYRAVREAPVPTIAVIQGNCFGCGVEFALHCDYRLASDTGETRFYMTELNDYLFIPLFGSTWTLPETVGLADAIDLLLWGARWDARTAYARGLVDEVVPYAELPERRQGLVARVLAGTQPSRRRGPVVWGADEDRALECARRRIARLPPVYRPVYTEGLALLEAGARRRKTLPEHQRDELAASAASALSPIGKAAYAFFYLRQMASERAAGRVRGGDRAVTIAADLDGDQSARAFVDELRRRALPGVTFVEGTSADVCLASAGRAAAGVTVHVGLCREPTGDVALYAPGYRSGGCLVEVATRPGAGPAAGDVAALVRMLQRLGFEVARTTPPHGFVTNALLAAYFAPLVRAVARGQNPVRIQGALRAFGFVRLPGELLAGLDATALASELAAALDRPRSDVAGALALLATAEPTDSDDDAVVVDALCISLLGALQAARARREIRDPTIADVIAREVLDFPRHRCSLSAWLRVDRVDRALRREAAIAPLVTADALASAATFVSARRELYR